ncbi:MAG TPA: hypothetical protein VIE63_17605 [Ramlibacter sp.]|jgi:hypothetical protein
MRYALLAAAFVSSLVCAQTPERPNMPVFRSGPWFVVRSVHDGGSVVACTGFYRANPHVQLSKDMLVIQTSDEVQAVAFGFDDQPMGAQRPLTDAEKDMKGIAFTGDDFAKLSASRKVRIHAVTPQGTVRHEFELAGLPAALENIDAGCPVPAQKPIRRRKRS